MISESEITELINGSITMYSKLSSVEQTADGLTQKYTDISSKYDTVTKQYSELDSKVAEYKSSVDGLSANISAVSTTLKNDYSTTSAMNAAITANVSSVLATVSETYATQDRVGKLETWKNQAEQKITADAIVSTVTSSSSWGDKADKATLISQINQSAEQIKIRGSIIDLQGNISITDISNDAINTIKNYSITALSDAKKYADDCDELVLEGSQDYTRTYTLSEIGKLEASGGNLVKGYRFSDDNIKAYWNTAGTIKSGQNDPDGGKNAAAIVADAANCYLASKRNENTIINATGRYTVTFWAKASKAQTVTFSFNKVSESIALTTTWKKFSFIKDITSIAASGSLIIFGGSNSISTGDGTIYIYRPDVRHGYSSEDIFNLLTNNGNIQGMYMTGGKLYWNGACIKSKSITTAALAADSVTAEKIKVDDLYSLKASIAGFKISADTISHQSTTKPESGIGQTYYDTYFSSRDKRLTFRKGPGTSDYMTFGIKGLRTSSWKCLDLISDADVESGDFSSGNHHSLGYTNIYGILYVAAGLKVAGTKQAVRETENYGEKGVYCYETPTPYFGDIGSGEIAADGKCYVDIEDILKEMINTEMQYYVFLQKRGEGDLYVSECSPDYFIVTGTPGLKFFWELKAKQKGYEYNRYEGEDRVVGFRNIAYDDEYIAETEKLIEEREDI
ncbi:MAG: hypothetical protein ACLUFS_10285 [Blautia massiliensis (ex Durand et al. 2017)]|uniref:hypothetical protein n=1 Tax=Blautia massiliensis (ex Durand et al. 2017) TaxID=1737424 RepID=UPI003991D9B7